MTQMNVDLAALIGSRICHDLISPIGAINNGLELLTMTDAKAGPEMGLIGESVNNANARIRFFRIAFGAAGHQLVGDAEVVSILRDLFENSRLDVNWSLNGPQPRTSVRLAFLAILCVENALPFGGQVVVTLDPKGWQILGAADRVNVDTPLWSFLDQATVCRQSVDALQPAQVQFPLLAEMVRTEGRSLQASVTDASITIRFS